MRKKQQQPELTSQVEQPASEQTSAQQGDYSPEEIKQLVDEIVAEPAPRRVWEVDFLRGFMILFVVWDHLMWDLSNWGPYTTKFFTCLYEFSLKYQTGVLRAATHDAFVTMFVFTSGVSCSFSHSNRKRAIKMLVFAMALTAVTFAVSSIINENVTMHFNVIHVIALSVLLWTVIEWCWSKCNKNWKKNIFGVVMAAVIITVLVVGTCANTPGGAWKNESPAFFFLANHADSVPGFIDFWGGDYLPFFPDFGWFLVGAFLGKFIYKEKKSLFPSVNPKWVCPFTFCGRYSIWIYFGSQVLFAGLLLLLAQVCHCI